MPRLVAFAVVAVLSALSACDRGGDTNGDATATSTTSTAAALTTSTTEAVQVIEVTAEGGRPAGGVRREQVALGTLVRLVVHSDVADEVHVHTYDLFADVTAGGSAEIPFVADIPGVIEVELEGSHTHILTLEVRPE